MERVKQDETESQNKWIDELGEVFVAGAADTTAAKISVKEEEQLGMDIAEKMGKE